MSILEFIASVVGSLAWPIVALTAVIVLRSQLKELAARLIARFPALTEFSGLGVSIKFSESVGELAQDVKKLKEAAVADQATGTDHATVAKRDGSASEVSLPFEGLQASPASEEPLVTLLRAYWVVESAAQRALERHGLNPDSRPIGVTQALRILEKKTSRVDRGFRNIVEELVSLRNQAVHNRVQVTPEDAYRFTWIAEDIAEYLDRL